MGRSTKKNNNKNSKGNEDNINPIGDGNNNKNDQIIDQVSSTSKRRTPRRKNEQNASKITATKSVSHNNEEHNDDTYQQEYQSEGHLAVNSTTTPSNDERIEHQENPQGNGNQETMNNKHESDIEELDYVDDLLIDD